MRGCCAGRCVCARTVNCAGRRAGSVGGCGAGATQERTCVARAPSTEGREDGVAGDAEDAGLASAGGERARAAMCCCGVRMGREGRGRAGCGVDMQRVGGMGRWGRRRRAGRRGAGGAAWRGEEEGDGAEEGAPAGAPEGMSAAQAWMPEEPLPIQAARGRGSVSGKGASSVSAPSEEKEGAVVEKKGEAEEEGSSWVRHSREQ